MIFPDMTLRLSSLPAHIVVFEGVFSLPLFVFFLSQTYREGTLTLSWGLYLLMVWVTLGAVGGAFFWYAVSRPLTRRRSE
jgi:hypothetical protein